MSLTKIELQYQPIREWFLENGYESLIHELKLCFLNEPVTNNYGWKMLEHDNSRLTINITDHTGLNSPSDQDMVFTFYDRMTGRFLLESDRFENGERQQLTFRVIG